MEDSQAMKGRASIKIAFIRWEHNQKKKINKNGNEHQTNLIHLNNI